MIIPKRKYKISKGSAEMTLNKNKSKNKKIIKLKHIKIIDADSFICFFWNR